MSVPSEIIDTRMSKFIEACAACGVRVTHQRLEIYRELASTQNHPDADTIHKRVRGRIPSISRDTVYRNLKLLSGRGLISIVGMSHERLRFDANMGPHHHFVCMQCGLIRDFCSQHLQSSKFPAEAAEFGDPVSQHLEVKGVCRACRPLTMSSG